MRSVGLYPKVTDWQDISKSSTGLRTIAARIRNTKSELDELGETTYYTVENEDLTLERALSLFENNKKLLVILITKKGTGTYPPMGIITNADVIDIQKVLDNY